MPRPDPLAGLWSPEWRAYDAVARALPACSHNQAWKALGRGRPQPPDCMENREWRTALRAAWVAHLAALQGVPGVGALCAQEALW